jgi:hypothetical protein
MGWSSAAYPRKYVTSVRACQSGSTRQKILWAPWESGKGQEGNIKTRCGWMEDMSRFVALSVIGDLHSEEDLEEHENTIHLSLIDVSRWCSQNLRREEKDI